MTTVTFDTLKAAKTFKSAGFTEEQADAQVEVHMHVTENLATKHDLKILEHSLAVTLWKMQSATIAIVLGGVFTMLKFMPLS